jgi:hypothetical protein
VVTEGNGTQDNPVDQDQQSLDQAQGGGSPLSVSAADYQALVSQLQLQERQMRGIQGRVDKGDAEVKRLLAKEQEREQETTHRWANEQLENFPEDQQPLLRDFYERSRQQASAPDSTPSAGSTEMDQVQNQIIAFVRETVGMEHTDVPEAAWNILRDPVMPIDQRNQAFADACFREKFRLGEARAANRTQVPPTVAPETRNPPVESAPGARTSPTALNVLEDMITGLLTVDQAMAQAAELGESHIFAS